MISFRTAIARDKSDRPSGSVRFLLAFALCAAGALFSIIGVAADAAAPRSAAPTQQTSAPCVVLPLPYRCQSWAATYAGSGNGAGIAVGLGQNSRVTAVSPDGKLLYVAGTSIGSNSTYDAVVIAFDTATGAQQWVSTYSGAANGADAASYALALSPDGSMVFVTGTINGGLFTIALAADNGKQVWSATLNGFGGPPDITTDGKQVYVCGYGTYPDPDQSLHTKAVTVAYDVVTGAQLWLAHDLGNPGAVSLGAKIAASPDGSRVYMAGGKIGAGNYVVDVLLFTYIAATGELVQETHYGPTQGFPPAGIAVSADGSRVFVEEANVETTLNQALTIAYDSAGNNLWAQRYPTSCLDVNCATRPWYYGPITVSPNGSTVFVTGTYLHILNEQAFVTLAYDAATGTEKWEAMYPHNVVDNIVGPVIVANPNGKEIYVTGPANNSNSTTIAYDSVTGNQNWLGIYGVGSPQGIAVSPDGGQVFVAGGVVNAQTQPAGTQTDLFALAYDVTAPPLTPAPALTGAVSHRSHGAAGPFDIDLPVIGRSGIECRYGGPTNDYTMIFSFSKDLTAVGDASVTSGTGSVSSSSIGPHSNQYTVNLTGVTNAQYISVMLTGVVDSAGEVGNFSDTMGVLLGDTTGDGFVNSADISQTKSQSGQPVTSSNFREDVNADGFTNSADISLVKSKSGTALP